MRAVTIRFALGLCGCLAACSLTPPEGAASSDSIDTAVPAGAAAIPHYPSAEVCNGGTYRCFARVRTLQSGERAAAATPQGWGPPDLVKAYNYNPALTPGATVAIIGAYGYANLESDLAMYRSTYGLPPCTIASGCLTVVNQTGQTSPLPGAAPANDDWTQETALDVDMTSAACPNCKILVVQANNDLSDGLFVANDTAATFNPTVISNSWGGPEQSAQEVANLEPYFAHPGIAIFVASGDIGYDDANQGADYPASSQYTFAVGGTTLQTDQSLRGYTETAWNGGGSSCSKAVAKPAWQTSSACGKRMSVDVSAVADPDTGVAVYNADGGGWTVTGGTSAASPLVASLFALTNHGGEIAKFAYDNAGSFFDATSGTNGTCGNVLCSAGVGWDGPTGNGTPNGAMLAGALAPTLTIGSPFDGQSVPPGFTVATTCTPNDGATVAEVDITIDGEPLGKLTTGPYNLVAPSTFANGKHAIVVTCTTSAIAQVTERLSVTQTQACTVDTDCSNTGDICYLGACIAGGTIGNGLGTTCMMDSDCASGVCTADGSASECSVTCDPANDLCPTGFKCDAQSSGGQCLPNGETGGGGGCCDAGRGGPSALLGLGIALVALRPRRRRLGR